MLSSFWIRLSCPYVNVCRWKAVYAVYVHYVSEMSRLNSSLIVAVSKLTVLSCSALCLYLSAFVCDCTLPVPGVCFGP
jgi:hypothetical protein